MDALIIIDMQEDYLGNKRNMRLYPYNVEQLIHNINDRIENYSKDTIIYVTNKFLWEFDRTPKKFVRGLTVVNETIFQKRVGSCFSNKALMIYLKERGINEIELVGVDGNYCVGSSALSGAKLGFKIIWNKQCIGVGKQSKFAYMQHRLKKAGIKFI